MLAVGDRAFRRDRALVQERARIGRDEADLADERGCPQRVRCHALDADASGGRAHEAREESQEGRLSRAVATHDRDDLTPGDREVDVVQHVGWSVPGGHVRHAGDRLAERRRDPNGRRDRIEPIEQRSRRAPRVAHRQRQWRPTGEACERDHRRRNRRAGHHGHRRSDGQATVCSDDCDTRRVLHDPFQSMFGEENGEAEIVDESGEDRQHVLGRARIERRGGFVEDQDTRRCREHRTDRDSLRLTRRERCERSPSKCSDAEKVEHVLDAAAHHVGRDAEILHRVRELVLDGVGDEARGRVLADDADAVGELSRRCDGRDAVNGHSSEQGTAGEVRDEPVHGSQQRRLPGARLSDDEEELALVDCEVRIDQRGRRRVGIRERHVVERDHGVVSAGSRGDAKAGVAAASMPIAGSRGSPGATSGL